MQNVLILILSFFSFFCFSQVKYTSNLDVLKSVMDSKNLTENYDSFYNGGIEKSIDCKSFDIDKFIDDAKMFLGTPHSSRSELGIDCSGLVYTCFKNQGLKFARTAQDFGRYGEIIINKQDLKKGDLVFFTRTFSTFKLITHVGIFLGGDKFIHSSSSKGVIISNIHDKYYWGDRFIFGTRMLK